MDKKYSAQPIIEKVLLSYWGLPNLQVINRNECAIEARHRASYGLHQISKLKSLFKRVALLGPTDQWQ